MAEDRFKNEGCGFKKVVFLYYNINFSKSQVCRPGLSSNNHGIIAYRSMSGAGCQA